MKSWIEGLGSLALVCLLMAAPAAAADRSDSLPIENLRLPLQHYEDGTVKMQLKAEHALVPTSGGVIIASNVVVELFHADQSLDIVVYADDCRYNREKEEADSDSPVRIERDGVVISGKGFRWQAEEQRVKILSMAKVAFRRNLSRTSSVRETAGKEETP